MNIPNNTLEEVSRKFSVRFATVDDAQQIVDIRIASWKDGYQGLIDQAFLDLLETTPERIEKMKGIIENGSSEFFVYEENGIIMGFLHGGKARDIADCAYEIYAFYVDPQHQKKGIGTKLFASFFEKYGTGNICLWTLPESKGAFFYKKMGGKLDGEKEQDIGGKMYKEVRYSWKR